MRVLIATEATPSVWGDVLSLLASLGEVEFHLAIMGAVRPDLPAGVRTRYMPFRVDGAWDDLSRAGSWLLQVEHELAPDLVHLNSYAHAALPWRAPVVLTARELPADPFGIYGDLVAEALLAAAAVAAPTEARLIELARHFHLPRWAVVAASAADYGPLYLRFARRTEMNPAA
jgi:hypothetical protein